MDKCYTQMPSNFEYIPQEYFEDLQKDIDMLCDAGLKSKILFLYNNAGDKDIEDALVEMVLITK